MTVPDSLRPPAPRGTPPKPPPGRRWLWVTLLALFLIGVPAWVVLSRFPREPQSGRQRAAEQFVQAIVAGSAVEPGRTRTGFETAYALLSPAKREALPFDVFFEDWSRLFEERGFIVDHVRVTEWDARGLSQPVSYLLFLGGEQEEHAKLDTVRLDIFLQRLQGHRF
jgi:hypothetical protein